MNRIGSLKRFFDAITTACSTGPTFGICVFVTCRASGFLFSSEAGFARATSSFTRGLEALVFVAPHYSDGVGACFQMAACATGGLIGCAEYVRAQASLWSMDGPGIATALHKQAFRERTVASIVLPAERKVGLDLFGTPPLRRLPGEIKGRFSTAHFGKKDGGVPLSPPTPTRAPLIVCKPAASSWSPCPMLCIVSPSSR